MPSKPMFVFPSIGSSFSLDLHHHCPLEASNCSMLPLCCSYMNTLPQFYMKFELSQIIACPALQACLSDYAKMIKWWHGNWLLKTKLWPKHQKSSSKYHCLLELGCSIRMYLKASTLLDWVKTGISKQIKKKIQF